MQNSFGFVFDAGSGISRVTVKTLRLFSKVKKGDRITREAEPTHNPDTALDMFA